MKAVVLVGVFGTRLRPLTEKMKKKLLPPWPRADHLEVPRPEHRERARYASDRDATGRRHPRDVAGADRDLPAAMTSPPCRRCGVLGRSCPFNLLG